MNTINEFLTPELKEWQCPAIEELDLLDTAAKPYFFVEETGFQGPQGS